jgi:hypothetical protein
MGIRIPTRRHPCPTYDNLDITRKKNWCWPYSQAVWLGDEDIFRWFAVVIVVVVVVMVTLVVEGSGCTRFSKFHPSQNTE